MREIAFNPQKLVAPLEDVPRPARTKEDGSFASVLKGFINDVNALQLDADKAIEKLNVGEVSDVHQVMIAAEKADIAFRMMMEVRNKLLEAYQEIMRMQV